MTDPDRIKSGLDDNSPSILAQMILTGIQKRGGRVDVTRTAIEARILAKEKHEPLLGPLRTLLKQKVLAEVDGGIEVNREKGTLLDKVM